MVAIYAAGAVLVDEGVVARTNHAVKIARIIETTDDIVVAAIQEDLDNLDQTLWTDNNNSRCSFFAGERVQGDLSDAATVTLINNSGSACGYVVEGSSVSMQGL